VISFHDVPAKISCLGNQVHFLPAVLPDVSGEEAPGGVVKRKSPGIAQTVSPDFRQAATRGEGIVGRDRVLLLGCKRRVYSNAKNLAE
jgi:hypothetical protein